MTKTSSFVVFRNENEVSTQEVINRFKEELTSINLYEKSDIELLVDLMAKNPTDRFMISVTPDVEGAQGDILIWAKGTTMYNQNRPNLKHLKKTTNMVLQETDSITGDHRIIPLEGSNVEVKVGEFVPEFLKGKNRWGDRNYRGMLVTSDKPFLVYHREHGNVSLPAGEYMVCTSLDAKSLTRMMD